MENIKLIEISTTAFKEENILLVTNLTDKQIIDVIKPIVLMERDTNILRSFYDNDSLYEALCNAYPTNIIHQYSTDNFNTITI